MDIEYRVLSSNTKWTMDGDTSSASHDNTIQNWNLMENELTHDERYTSNSLKGRREGGRDLRFGIGGHNIVEHVFICEELGTESPIA